MNSSGSLIPLFVDVFSFFTILDVEEEEEEEEEDEEEEEVDEEELIFLNAKPPPTFLKNPFYP